jgi:hypothetical protein
VDQFGRISSSGHYGHGSQQVLPQGHILDLLPQYFFLSRILVQVRPMYTDANDTGLSQ